MKPTDLSSMLFLAGASALWLAPLPALALPLHNWTEVAGSPAGQISAVVPDGPADILDGARATVYYSDGSSDTALFVGATSGGTRFSVARTGAFTLVAQSDGSSASAPAFSISNRDSVRTLIGFAIDGAGDGAGHTAFDRGLGVVSTNPSTAGSSSGIDLSLDFTKRSFLTGTVAVSYSHPLGLAGAAPVGDLFRSVAVQMDLSTVVGLPPVTAFSAAFSSINFSTDIDAVNHVAAAPVTEPGAGALLLGGLAALRLRGRRGLPSNGGPAAG